MLQYVGGASAVYASTACVAVSEGSEGVWGHWSIQHLADFRRLTCGDSVIHPPSLVTFASLNDEEGEFILDWLEGHVFADQPGSCTISCHKVADATHRPYLIEGSVQFGGAAVTPEDMYDRVSPFLADIDLLVFETMPGEYPGSRFIHFLHLQH